MIIRLTPTTSEAIPSQTRISSVIHHPIISDPTVPEISSAYVTDLATDGSAELDPDGLPTSSSATDTFSLFAIPPHLTQTARCADRPKPTRLHTTRTRIAVSLSALNHCRYLILTILAILKRGRRRDAVRPLGSPRGQARPPATYKRGLREQAHVLSPPLPRGTYARLCGDVERGISAGRGAKDKHFFCRRRLGRADGKEFYNTSLSHSTWKRSRTP